MKLTRIVGAACALALLSSVSTSSIASIVYSVDRTIGAGTVTGTIETNGNLGVLADSDILNVNLTVSAPNLPGSPESLPWFTGISGNAVSATDTQLLFDFSASGDNYFAVQGPGDPETTGVYGVFWHLETAGFSAVGFGEHITYVNSVGNEVTIQSVIPTGSVVFAEVTTVPVPAAVWLFGSGLLALASISRRKTS